MWANTLYINQLARGLATSGMKHHHNAVAIHAIPLARLEPYTRVFLPLAGNPGHECLPIYPDMPQSITGMRRAVVQPIPQSAFWHTQLIRQFTDRVEHGEQTGDFHDDCVGKLDTGIG
jgi:hypothetical protein